MKDQTAREKLLEKRSNARLAEFNPATATTVKASRTWGELYCLTETLYITPDGTFVYVSRTTGWLPEDDHQEMREIVATEACRAIKYMQGVTDKLLYENARCGDGA